MLAFATQQASLLQQALPFMLPVCPDKVAAKLTEVLDRRLGASAAIRHLASHGYTEAQAQRACLDYYNSEPAAAGPIDGKKLLKWVRLRPGSDTLNR